jgi:hypothetical protein
MDDYLRILKKELKDFPTEEQAAILDEIQSHAESGQDDTRMGMDEEQRRRKLMNELGSPQDLGKGLKALYRPNRFAEYLLIALPYTLSLFMTDLYLRLRPLYPWMDVRLNVLFDLALIAIGIWRRSILVTLFWINIAVLQLSYIVLQGVWQPYWYFGVQTIAWAVLLVGLLALMSRIVWKNRHDSLILVYALLPLFMEMVGNAVWNIHPVNYKFNPLDRSLLVIFLRLQGGSITYYGTLLTMALFILASNRHLRWSALGLSALMIGFGRQYLLDYQTGATAMVAQWVYYLYVLLPLALVLAGWLLERAQRRRMQPAA